MNKLKFLILFLVAPALFAQVVHRFTGDRFTHYRYDDWFSYATALEITSVDMDENFIYFASRSGGILRYDKYNDQWDFPFTTSNGLRSNSVYQVVFNQSDGILYARTPAGVDVYRPAEHIWRPAPWSEMPPVNSPDYKTGDDQPYRFPPYYRPLNRELPDFFTDISFVYQLGGIVYDRHNREFRFTDRIIDSWQRLWVGTNGIGPMKAELNRTFLESTPQSIPYISPRDIYIDEDACWIGGQRLPGPVGGITRWDRNSNNWQYYEAPYVSGIYKDDVFSINGDGRFVAFATSLGLTLFDKRRDAWRTFDTGQGLQGNRVHDMLFIRDTCYVATEYGLSLLDLRSMKIGDPIESTLDNVRIYQLAYNDSLLWAATTFGLYSIDPGSGSIKFHTTRAAVSDYNLTAVAVVDDVVWMGGSYGVLYWDLSNDEWRSFPGLNFNAEIRDIAQTRNTIWFATNRGLLKYDRKRDYWRLFTQADGLISDNVFHVDPEGRDLWISTDKGITTFRWYRKSRLD